MFFCCNCRIRRFDFLQRNMLLNSNWNKTIDFLNILLNSQFRGMFRHFFRVLYVNTFGFLKMFNRRRFSTLVLIPLDARRKLRTLTHFSSVVDFYTPWKTSETFRFLTFSGGVEMEHWAKMDQTFMQLLGRHLNVLNTFNSRLCI